MRNILLAAVVASGLVGCVGGIDDPATPPGPGPAPAPGDGDTAAAKAAFDSNVFPILVGKCKICHTSGAPLGNVTGFVDPEASKGYQTATGYQALIGTWTPDAPVLSKIAGGHNNVVYTDAEKASITDWLAKELAERSGTAGDGSAAPPPGTESATAATDRLLKEWSGCMTLTNFKTANMKAWGNLRADNSACKTCHINGEFGEVAMDVDDPFFTVIATNRYYMAQYFTIDFSQGVANAKMIVNTAPFINVGQALPPHTEHPRFNPTNNAGMTALNKFYDLTVANKAAGTCGPSQLK